MRLNGTLISACPLACIKALQISGGKCENARVPEFQDHDYETDVVGDTAVVTFRYDMIYERSGGDIAQPA